jgi:hypothetical protein
MSLPGLSCDTTDRGTGDGSGCDLSVTATTDRRCELTYLVIVYGHGATDTAGCVIRRLTAGSVLRGLDGIDDARLRAASQCR